MDCKYPEEPGHLTKEQIWSLFKENYPDTDYDDFEAKFEVVDFDGGGEIEFDEFLDFDL